MVAVRSSSNESTATFPRTPLNVRFASKTTSKDDRHTALFDDQCRDGMSRIALEGGILPGRDLSRSREPDRNATDSGDLRPISRVSPLGAFLDDAGARSILPCLGRTCGTKTWSTLMLGPRCWAVCLLNELWTRQRPLRFRREDIHLNQTHPPFNQPKLGIKARDEQMIKATLPMYRLRFLLGPQWVQWGGPWRGRRWAATALVRWSADRRSTRRDFDRRNDSTAG